jgi:hypothetical protein
VVYDILFNPLKKFPGPVYAAASRIPYLFAVVTGRYVPWVQALHKQYGSVVRVAPDELSFTDSRAWKDAYGHRQGSKSTIHCQHMWVFIWC